MGSMNRKNWSIYNLLKHGTLRPLDESFDESELNRTWSDNRNSQWDVLIRKLSGNRSGDTNSKKPSVIERTSIPQVERTKKTFPTASTYKGTWTVLGMSGYGVYTFPSGVIYEGNFDDGMFHGTGKLIYPDGIVMNGTWDKGDLKHRRLIFCDGVEYRDGDWKYCVLPDRRYHIEICEGLRPEGHSHITAHDSPNIPGDYYDTGDGLYVPRFDSVCCYDDYMEFIRTPCPEERKWILENCRKGADDSIGPIPSLFDVFYEATDTLDPTAFIKEVRQFFGDISEREIEASEDSFEQETKDVLRWQRIYGKSLGFTPWTEFHRRCTQCGKKKI